MAKKITKLNIFVLQICSHRNITHLAVIKRRTTTKLGKLKGGVNVETSLNVSLKQ